MPRLGKFCVTALVTLTTIVHLRNAHARQLQHTERIKDGSEYLATGGDVFSMRKIRTYAGPRLNDSSAPSALIRPDGEYCERWAVYVATVESTERVKQLGNMDEWCVVVVMDKAGRDEYNIPGVTYLSPADQEALPYHIKKLLSWDHFGRKNIGYLYAVHHGAKVIYDSGGDYALARQETGVLYKDSQPNLPYLLQFSGSGSAIVHNPYPCLGGASNVWPRGLPLEAIHDAKSHACEVTKDINITVASDGRSRVLGVVQTLANHEPDVDAIYRLTSPGGGVPFSLRDGPTLSSPSQLKIVPDSAFTPYNAQATLHFEPVFWGMLLPVTVHERVSDIWRSYFTQALLPSVGAVVAFSQPSVAQVGNLHKYWADFDAELPLYRQSGALVSFLAKFRRRLMDEVASSTPADVSLLERIESLAVLMYEHGIIEYADVELSQAWLRDLLAIGYAPNVFTHHGAHAEAGVQAVETPAVDATTRGIEYREETRRAEAVMDERPSVVLVVGVISNRPEKREAIRNTWLAWADDRVVVRFFTDVPNTGDFENDRQAAAALKEEADSHGDLVMIEVYKGMNGVRLVEVMKWMSKRFVFDYFLRLDDDYFLCLRRLVDDLEITYLVEDSLPPPYIAQYSHPAIYVGHRYCTKFGSRIDEAYLLLSAPLVNRVLSIPDLQCSVHAGITTGWWFKPGGQVNQEGDVEWVNDLRIDHNGKWWQPEKKGGAPKEAYPSVCEKRMAIHRSNVGQMDTLWAAAKDRSGPERVGALFHYMDDGRCPNVKFGASDQAMINDKQQPCSPP